MQVQVLSFALKKKEKETTMTMQRLLFEDGGLLSFAGSVSVPPSVSRGGVFLSESVCKQVALWPLAERKARFAEIVELNANTTP